MPVSQEKFLGAVRKKYPGEYDAVDDDKLLKAIFKKYPEYIPQVEDPPPKLGPEYIPQGGRGVGPGNVPLRPETTQPLEVAQPSATNVAQQELPPQQSLVSLTEQALGTKADLTPKQFAPSTASIPQQEFIEPGGVTDLTAQMAESTTPTETAVATQPVDTKGRQALSDRFMFENLANAGLLNIPEQSIAQSDFTPKREFGKDGPSIGESALSALYKMAGGSYAAIDLAASTVYDAFAIPQNVIANVFDINVGTSAQRMKDNYPEINKAVNKYILPQDVALAEAEKLSATQYYDNSITGYIEAGDYKNAASLLGYQVLENLPQQLEIFGLAFLTGNPMLGISLLSAQAAGGKFHQLKESDMPDYVKYTNAISTGMSEYLTESYIGTGPIIKRFMGANWKKSVSSGVSRWLRDIGYGIRQEGFEEVVQSISENIIDITTNNRNKNGELPGIFDGVGDAALIGGVSGGLLSGGTSIATASKAKQYNDYRDAVAQQQQALVELYNNQEMSTILKETAELRTQDGVPTAVRGEETGTEKPIEGKESQSVKPAEPEVQKKAPKEPVKAPKKKAAPKKPVVKEIMVATVKRRGTKFDVWRVGGKLELRSRKKDSSGNPMQTLPYSEKQLQQYRNRSAGGRKAAKTAKEAKTTIPKSALNEMPALKAVFGVEVGSDYSGTFDGVLVGNSKVWVEGGDVALNYDEAIIEGYRDALGLSDEVEINVDDVIAQAQQEIEGYRERGGTRENIENQLAQEQEQMEKDLKQGEMSDEEIERLGAIATEEDFQREIEATEAEIGLSETETKKAKKPVKKYPAKKTLSQEGDTQEILKGTAQGLELKQQTDETIRKTAILKFIEDQFGVPIRRKLTQRMGKATGKYWTEAEVIRTVLEDLETVAHEIAHHIDKKIPGDWKNLLPLGIVRELKNLDYDQKKRRPGEGFAELVRFWLTEDNLEIISPKLNVWFEGAFKKDNLETYEKLTELKKKLKVWYEQGAVNRVKTSIDYRGEHSELTRLDKVKQAWQGIYKDWIDAFEPLARGVKRFEKKTGVKLRPSQNPYALATANNLKSRAISKTMIEDGMINEQGEVIGKSLVEVLAPIVKTTSAKEWFSPTTSKAVEDFVAYAVALRGKEWLTREKPINPGFSLTDAEQTIKELHTPERLKAAKDLTEWANQLQDWVIRAANIPEADVQAMRDANPIYVPFLRYFVNEADRVSGTAGAEIGTKTAKGSTRPIVNPLESLITMAQNTVDMANKQRIVNAIINMSEVPGAGEFVDRIARPIQGIKVNVDDIIDKLFDVGITADESESTGASLVTFFQAASKYTGKDNVVVVWRGVKQKDGSVKVKPQFFEIDQDFYEALQDSPENYQGNFAMSLAVFARLLRLGATQLSGSFAFISNPARDIPMSLLTSKKDFPTPFGPLKGVIDDIVNSKKSDAWKFKALGGEMATMFGYDRFATMRMLDVMLLKSEGMKGKGLVVVKHPINFLRSFFQIWEMGPRISEFEASLKKYRSKEYTDKGWTEEDALIQARIDAQDLTVNFTRADTKGRPFNAISAFFNAGVQGIDKIARTAKENNKRFVMRGAMWITSVALFSWWDNRDKEWFKNLPLAYKYNNLFFEVDKNVYRVPLPFELGSIFAAMPMAMMDKYYADDPDAVRALMENMVGNFVPNLVPSAFKPVWDVATNRNWLGRPIESVGLRMRPVEHRYTEQSTALGKTLSKGVRGIQGRKPVFTLSPVQIDYLLNSYTGGLSSRLVNAYRSTHGASASDLPVIGRFILRIPERPARQMNDFYERRKALDELYSVKGEDGFSLLSESEEIERQNYQDLYTNVLEPANEAIREYSQGHNNEKLREIYLDIAKEIKAMNMFLYDNQFVKL